MLLVTSTMRMVHGVHGHTSNSGPGALSLCLHLVVDVSGLADGLVSSSTSSDNADHGSAVARDGPSASTGQSHSGLLSVFGVTDDDNRGA